MPVGEGGPNQALHHSKQTSNLWAGSQQVPLQVLCLVLEMLFQRDGQLNPSYCCRDPSQERMQNVLFLLYHHLSHDANSIIVPLLVAEARKMGKHAIRMLRLLCRCLFPHSMFQIGPLVARGGYSTVSPATSSRRFVSFPYILSLQ